VTSLNLPRQYLERPFTVNEGLAAGLTVSALRNPLLHRETRSVRSLGPPEDLQGRARAFAAALPSDVAFSHITSARLLGLPLPSRIVDSALHVMRSSDRTRIRRTGCRGHRGLETRGVEIVKGLRVVCGPDTWCDLGDLLTGLLTVDDLIVIGDAILARLGEEPSVLASVLESRVRPRGRTMLTEALGLIRAGARSPMESLTRLMFVRAGFPEPSLNTSVLDTDGGWLLTGDLVWKKKRVVAEYQGATHAPIRQRSHDADRMAMAVDDGVRMFEVFAEDVFDPRRRTRILTRMAKALGLDPGRLRIA